MYDLVIIGAGPAGLSAGLFAGEYKLSTAIVGKIVGGELTLAPMIFTYPGIEFIPGKQWIGTIQEQIVSLSIPIIEEAVSEIQKQENGFMVHTENKTLETKTIIFATGNTKRRPTYTGSSVAKVFGIEMRNDIYIKTNEHMQTNIPGIFAAGDCLGYDTALEQLVVASSLGARAAANVYQYLKNEKAPIVWGKASIPRL